MSEHDLEVVGLARQHRYAPTDERSAGGPVAPEQFTRGTDAQLQLARCDLQRVG